MANSKNVSTTRTRTQAANITQQKNTAITTGFKIQTLNSTLKFIRDNNRLSLEYPNLSRQQAEFVCSLIQHNNDGDIGLGFKSLYSSLFETLKEFNKMYDFDVLVGETSKGVYRVTIRKVPKRRSVPHDGIITMDISRQPLSESKNLNSSFTSDSTDISESSRHLSRSQSKKLVTKQKLIENLPHSFIKSSLQAILSFVDDPLRASLEFNDVTSNESRFLERVTSLAKKSDNHQHFTEDCVVLLKAINRSHHHHQPLQGTGLSRNDTRKRPDWYMDVNLGKMNKRTRLRNVSFHKVPMVGKDPDKQQVNRQSVPERIVEVRNNPKPTRPVVPDVTDKAVSKERRVKNVQKNSQSVKPEVPQQRAVSRDRRNHPIPAISFESAGLGNKTSHDVEPMDVDNKDTELKLQCNRKSKLLAAMSTPMESDIAQRMMRMMGWNGGALGTRGDGITEPIIPALHLSRGAGLGHMKEVTRSPRDFRTIFLKNLALFLQSGESETVVSYNTPVTKKEGSFVRTAVGGFNARKVIGVNLEEEVKAMIKILELMRSDPLLLIECGISDDRKSIKILKKITTSPPRPIKKTKNKTSKSQSRKTEISNRIEELNTTLELEKNCPSTKSAKALAYRIIFLENIKEFLQLTDSEKNYEFDCILNKRHRTYIQRVVTYVNRRCSKSKLPAEIENDIFKDILKVAGDCYMHVVFSNHKLTLKKKYYQKRFTNSALLPPPKSTDLQNTIIYKNSVASSYNENVAVDYVILIEEKREIIVKSDSDSVKSQIMTPKSDINEDCDISKDISNESILLEMLEGESDLNSNDSMLDKDISELDADLADAGVSCDLNLKMEDNFKIKDLNLKMEDQKSENEQEFINKDLNLNLEDQKSTHVDEFINRDLNLNLEHRFENDSDLNLEDEVKVKIENEEDFEVNNNIDLIKNKNNREFDPDFTIGNDLKCDSQVDDLSSVSNSSKRSRSSSDDLEQRFKIAKSERIKKVCIAPKNYPKENVTRDTVEKIQLLISDFIDNSTYLPLLECHGVQDGGLIYSCHNENSLLWIKNVTSVASLDLNVFDANFCEQTNFIVQFRINSFVREEVDIIIRRLELYNPGLDTSSWKVLNEHICADFIVITVDIDDLSLKFISENDFSLFLGIDKARFTIVFD